MSAKVTFIHTVPSLAETFRDLAGRLLPDAAVDEVVMEHLLQRTVAEGHVAPRTERELAEAVTAAAEEADIVMVTCSTLGTAVDALAGRSGLPVMRVDEAMARRAVETGDRIGVLATLPTTLEPTVALLERIAPADRPIEVLPHLCAGAFDAVRSGDGERHDALVRAGLEALLADGVDVVVLAQASMARAVESLPAEPPVPVLTSPRLAVEHLARELTG